ncbi:GNAT family N-acetyltransferase [Amycolatopsis sp. NPDC004079]|uniref:GNAT family N-acetyltransferase n=1 Tax=Amycolatopsis sp. NPDC004079 TaxID=3154549 RepID=UPI0033B83009
MTEQKLIRGWASGTAGVKIRLATADDIPAIAELAPAAGLELGAEMAEAIRSGAMGTAHRAGLAGRGREHGQPAFSRAIAQAFAEHGPDHVYAVAALVLVAEHREHGVIGTVIAFPPGNVAEQYVEHAERTGAAAPDVRKIIAGGAIALAKVSALAVAEPHRGSGIGAALLSRTKKVYFANGYIYVYGQIRPDRPGLAAFYRRQGFDVREPDEGLDLWVVFGIPGGILPDQGERFFVRGRPRDD